MSDYKVISDSIGEIKGLVLIVENGIFILISQGTYKLGTTALALPVKSDEGFMVSYGTQVFGVRNEVLAKSISERIANKKNKMVIASVMIKEEKPDLIDKILKLVNRLSVKI
ncbi:MAG: hypothetical protein ACTSYQ_01350 [Candidatus Odinarchaeia archaeon]